MNRKNLLLLASFAFAALPACSNNGPGDGGTSTSAGASGGSSGGVGGTTASANGGTTASANGGSTGKGTSGGTSSGIAGGTSGGTSGGATSSGNGGGTSGGVIPAVPALGSEIDRMGRPAINTALTDPFDTIEPITEDQEKNAYNSNDGGPAAWTAKVGGYVPVIAGNLAILDALDGVCGNQAFANLSPTYSDGGIPPTRYVALAGVLADDELYVDTTTDLTNGATSCGFLGAELEEFGFLPGQAGTGASGVSCGGRQPTEDVIDVEYNALALGITDLLTGKFDIQNGAGLVKDGGSNPPLSNTVAPFLGNPN